MFKQNFEKFRDQIGLIEVMFGIAVIGLTVQLIRIWIENAGH